MKKLLFFIFCAGLIVSTTVTAQNPLRIGFAFEGATPTGNFADQANTGFGVSGMVLWKYRPNISLYGSAGVLSWDGNSVFSPILRTDINLSFLGFPIKAGGRYYVNRSKNRFYLLGEVGFQFFRSKSKATIPEDPLFPDNRTSTFSATSTKAKLLAASGIGFQVPLSRKIMLDFSGRFEIVQNLKYIGFRAGFSLPIGSREE